jgi:hypothetical protein
MESRHRRLSAQRTVKLTVPSERPTTQKGKPKNSWRFLPAEVNLSSGPKEIVSTWNLPTSKAKSRV